VTAVPDRGQPSDVSCPTTTWCMAVDLSGRVMTFNGSAWTAPKVAFPRFDGHNPEVRAVSCPTTSFCLAVSGHGYGVYRSGTWTIVSSPLAPFRAVDCYSATRCGLLRGDYPGRGLTTWNGTSLSASVTAPWASRVDAIACPSATVCHAIGLEPNGGAIALRTSGSGWVASYLGQAWPHTTLDVSCPSASFCLATSGSAYRTWRWNGSTWANAAKTDDGQLLDVESVSCTSSSSCTAVGDGRSGRWNGKAWSVRDLFPIYGASYSMDCATSSTCLVVDDRGRWWRGGGSTWTTAKSFDPTSEWVSDLSCPNSSFCLATDLVGNAVRWNGTTWTGMTRLGTRPSSVECLSTTWCMTVDSQQGTYRIWTGSWGPAVTFDLVNWWPTLVCGSTTTCFVFQDGDVRRWNGRTWSNQIRLFSAAVPTTRCVGAGFCVAMDLNGMMRTWNGSTWAAARRTGVTYPGGLTCASRSFCMVVSGGNLYSTWNGTSWSVRRTLPPELGPISCTSATRCVGTGYDGSSWLWAGSSWARASSGPGFEALALDCRSTFCMAVGYEMSSWTR